MSTDLLEFEHTVMWSEVVETLTKCDKDSQFTYKAVIHLDDEGKEYDPLSVMQVSIRRDYVDAFADEMGCTLLIPLGKYTYKVYPNRNKLKITLSKYFIKENSTEIDYDKDIDSETFSATLIEEHQLPNVMQGQQTKDEASLDLVDVLPVRFQLFNKAVEQMRVILVGGIYRKTNVSNVLKSIIDGACSKIKIDGKRKLHGLDLVEAQNKKDYDQIVIPHATKLIDLPGILQKKYGVYSSGLGSYVQNDNWYIYSLFDTARYNKTQRTLNIYVLPKNKFPELERTYRTKAGEITVLTTDTTDFRGDNEISFSNDGNGVRFVSADTVMDSFVETKGNKAIVKRKSNINEFSSEIREDGNTFSPMSESKITANPFQEYSNLASRKGGVFKAIWNNSNPSLVEPGMPVRITYFEGNEIKQGFGVLLASTTVTVKVGDMMSDKHSTNSSLHIYSYMK